LCGWIIKHTRLLHFQLFQLGTHLSKAIEKALSNYCGCYRPHWLIKMEQVLAK
jgi:hypothetical protein